MLRLVLITLLAAPTAPPTSAPARLPLATTTHVRMGFTIDVPPQAQVTRNDAQLCLFEATVPGHAAPVQVEIERAATDVKLESARELAKAGGEVLRSEALGGGHVLVVLQAKEQQQQVWYFAKGRAGYLRAICRGPDSLLPDLERICKSLRYFAAK